MGVLQLSTPSFASRCPHPLFHRGQSSELLKTDNPTQRTDHRQPSLNASGSMPCSAGVIQMVGVDGSWVATVGRPPQLEVAHSRVVCALLWCSWAVSPIHLSFCACPQTRTQRQPRKSLTSVRRLSQKDHVAHLRATSFSGFMPAISVQTHLWQCSFPH